jgi:hypothetical protein
MAFIRKHGERVSDPTNTRAVNRQYEILRRVPWHLERSANKQQREILKARGHRVTGKGVIVDGPKDLHGEKIPGSKISISKSGTVVWRVNGRRDFIVGLTKEEKREFVRDPDALVSRKWEELKREHPSIANVRKYQVRLQWGAYRSRKDFSKHEFTRKGKSPSVEQLERIYTGKGRKHDEDKLTGLHFTVHLAGTRKKIR